MNDRLNITVIGGGIIGVQIARALQRQAHQVTLIDKQAPGRGTSFGNAGFIACDEIFPLAHGRILKSIPGLVANPLGPLAVNWQQIPRLLPWFYQFVRACSGDRVEQNIAALASLQKAAAGDWRDTLKREGISALMRENGAYKIFETKKGFDETAAERTQQTHHDIAWESKSAAALNDEIPELKHAVHGGIYYPAGMHTINPFDLTQALFEKFTADGGRFLQTEIKALIVKDNAVVGMNSTDNRLASEKVVIASGYQSGVLLKPLGFHVPLAAERGYHIELSHHEVAINTPIGFHERGFYVTPMTTGLRLAGTSEFTAADTDPEPRWRRAEILHQHFDELFPEVGQCETHRWMGRRPTLPDFLPVIGQAPAVNGLYLAFGHQHLGLTLSAVTAKLMCDLIGGGSSPVELSPFSLARFQ